ncbi:T cell activation RhoGTPase activating protein b [Poecilia latipinna]|uniref:T cell activation RhoGTPase activating protein b n=1 Tax=Poecilia latipinna TaxID=48699 RepID=A0A3B3V214_9TELE|nr:PREDICTED: T-cell activation Rho GTPase-activating protein-like [Poecilia latipinna]
MDLTDYGVAAMRRGSYDDAAASMHPQFRHLAQRRRSAPSLVFGKALGMPWSPIREEAPCWVSVEQSPFVLGLTSENGELLLDECVQVTEGTKTKERHLFLFTDVLIFAKLKSTASYRLKQRVNLEDVWLCDFEEEEKEEEDDSGTAGDVDPRLTLVLAWALTFCIVCFRSPEVKERWSDTLHRKIRDAITRTGCASSSPPDVLMKVLSGSIATKTLTGGGMEQIIVLTPEGDAKSCALSKQLNNQEERLTQSSETKWNLVRNRMKLRRTSSKACHANKGTKNQLFGQPLSNICPDDYSLPKPITDLLLLLRKMGPSTEGVFRKPCNTRLMKDLREQLDNGTDVDLESQQVHLLVGLLKCFLKELPHSLLRSDLYNRWTAALDHEDTEQRTLEIRRVFDDLPGPNKLLLQYLVCLFHCILESSDTNKMDASNLAVCIGPTLLQLDGTPLDVQREKMQKATELTQFLIENCGILGENIPCLLDTDEDSLSSVHHDSAYDSTDPDGDGEAGEKRSSTDGGRGSSSSYSSLSPSITTPSWQSDAAFDNKAPFNRRCSEPILLLPESLENLCSHARSHDDCSMQRDNFDGQPLKKQISDDSFLLKSRGGASSVLSFPKLSCSSNMDPLPYMGKDCSCSSLESTASNQSESSVFTSSPMGSPRSSKKDNSQALVTTNGKLDVPKLISEEKRRSQSMRVASKVLMRTRSLGAFSRSSLKKDTQKENPFPETLQEDSQSEADPSADVLLKPRPLSAIEVFKQVDSRLPSRPPTYEQAVQNIAPPPHYGSMTVQDAITQIRRSRPSSMNYDLPVREYSYNQDCFSQTAQDTIVERRQPFRQRAMSESVSKGQHEMVSRRCSQPVFEEFSYAKESYV